MNRQIFKVDAMIVDANGTYNMLSGYPKIFDSKSYDGDIEKAHRRAEGEYSSAWAGMCKIDTRKMQTVVLSTVDGFQLEKKSTGTLWEPDPEPVPPEPEPEETEGGEEA